MPGFVDRRKSGFSLLEILVVVIIISVLAGVTLPSYSIHIERVRASEGVQLLTALLAAQERYRLENSVYATAMASLDIDVTNSSNFTVPPNLYNLATRVASVVRADNSYTLCINSAGVVSCDGDANICSKYAAGGANICP